MITERTELLFIDEWVYDTMSPDQIKSILQGGYFTQAIKNQQPRRTMMNGAIYITAQALPKFGDDTAAIKCRLSEFYTKELPVKDKSAPAWMLEHSFECIMWVVKMLNEHRDQINPSELFYERGPDEDACARLVVDIDDEKADEMINCTGSNSESDSDDDSNSQSKNYSRTFLHGVLNREEFWGFLTFNLTF